MINLTLNGLISITLITLVWLLTFILTVTPAQAKVFSIEEAPGQIVYQSRQTVFDQNRQAWQVIAFQRVKSDQASPIYLRLVGFPGAAVIARESPLVLKNFLGEQFTAPTAMANLFTDGQQPEPHIAQYDISAVIPQLNVAIPIQLEIANPQNAPIVLNISPTTLNEWQHLQP